MSKLVAVYGDDLALENALGVLADIGLGSNTRVFGDGTSPDAPVDPERSAATGDYGGGTGAEPAGARFIVPPVASGGSGVPSASPTVLAPLAVPPGGSEAVGVVGEGPGVIDGTRELERVTGADTEEATFYSDVIKGGGSVLVVEGDPAEIDRAQAALEDHPGQGMTRH